MKPRELTWKELKYFCKLPKEQATAPLLENHTKLIGQARATEALEFGLQMKDKGYNIYVCGSTGTGRTTFAREFANKKAATEAIPPDLCYVYNFENPKCPKLLRLPAGMGKRLKKDLAELMDRLSTEIPKIFADKGYEQKKNDIVKILKVKQEEVIKSMTEEARKYDFEVKNSNTGIFFLPIIDGEVINEEQFESLTQEQRDAISKRSESIQQRASDALREIKEYEKVTKKDVDDLDYSLGLLTVGHYMSDILETFSDEPELLKHLKAIKEDILENLANFLSGESEEEEIALIPWQGKKNNDDTMSKYKINLLTDNSELTGAPVVVDYNPSYTNLVGEVEFDNEYGNFSTDFMKIKPGLLHKANGGYLILQAQDVLGNHHAWEILRRTLITEQIVIEPLREFNTGVAVSGIKAEPIQLDVKIIMIGGGFYYDILYTYDDYFEKLFKIRVDFDFEMKVMDTNISEIAHFVQQKAALPLDAGAIGRIIEHSSRLAERQDRLSTKFNRITEILEEAVVWAKLDGAKKLTAKYIQKAIDKREFRLNMFEEKLSEMIEDDMIMISTDGTKVGQINGLAVLDTGDHVFAKPSRITATTYMGSSGIVNIEKEADMSGAIHNKGVQVLKGYLGQMYAQNFPLSLSCRVCFEQNYSGIDGDSASSTELFAILSSLSGLPIRQDIAVTGSINQHGEIQPIGGATYKVEGFFDLCNARGLTGKQGVIIPTRNIRDLVLKDDVVKAVKKGLFHIYPISYVDEGIEILMETPAGEKDPYPFDTVHGKVYRKLRSYHKKGTKGE